MVGSNPKVRFELFPSCLVPVSGSQNQVLLETLAPSLCCRSTILSVTNWSGKMSVHERTDIEYQGTEPVTYLERSIRAKLVDGGGSLVVGGK